MVKRIVVVVSLVAFLCVSTPARAGDTDDAVVITAIVVGSVAAYVAFVLIMGQVAYGYDQMPTTPPLGSDEIGAKRDGLRFQPGCGHDPSRIGLVCW